MMRPPPPAEIEIDESDLDAVRGALFAQLDDDTGVRARLRDLPTSVRRLALAGWMLGLMMLAWPGWGTSTLGFGLAALALGWLSLRPLHRPPLPRIMELGVLAVALAGAGLVAFVGTGPAVGAAAHLGCFVPGMVLALAILAVWWFLSRGVIGFHALAAAAAGGMAANAFLSARCASANPEHLVMAHLSVLVLAMVVGWASSLRRA